MKKLRDFAIQEEREKAPYISFSARLVQLDSHNRYLTVSPDLVAELQSVYVQGDPEVVVPVNELHVTMMSSKTLLSPDQFRYLDSLVQYMGARYKGAAHPVREFQSFMTENDNGRLYHFMAELDADHVQESFVRELVAQVPLENYYSTTKPLHMSLVYSVPLENTGKYDDIISKLDPTNYHVTFDEITCKENNITEYVERLKKG